MATLLFFWIDTFVDFSFSPIVLEVGPKHLRSKATILGPALISLDFIDNLSISLKKHLMENLLRYACPSCYGYTF
ncbi:hypothetical protein UT300016_27990 [Clostridium senegalense]